MEKIEAETTQGGEDIVQVESPQVPSKKPRLSIFSALKTKVLDNKKPSTNEIDEYLLSDVVEEGDLSPLKYWSRNAKKFPALSELARRILPMPASSGNVERLFSIAGSVKRARRAQLKTENLDKILCVRQHLLNTKGEIESRISDD